MLGFLQRIGKALMLPVAVLPAVSLLLVLGMKDVLNIPFMNMAGIQVFDHLPLIFAIGVAIGLAKDSNGAAALAGAVGYYVLIGATTAINDSINMAILGGIISGVVAGLLYNRFYKIELPEWLGFFSGKRFIPIITAFVMLLLAIIFGYIWPPIQDQLTSFGEWIIDAGALGAGLYGFFNRLLIPLGLHHVLNSFIWFVFGDYNGATGDLNRFFAGDPSAGLFEAGFYPIMMFGLPAAAFAMILASKKKNRKVVAGVLIGGALTSFITGITEPLEFLFMFLSPLLFFVHAILTGFSLAIVYLLNVHQAFGFSAGLIDYLVTFKLAKNPLTILPVGLVYAVVYFFVFYFLIKKLDLKTLGREDEITDETLQVSKKTLKYEKIAESIVEGLGGYENLRNVDHCITRLRIQVEDMNRVNEIDLKSAGAKGVIKMNQHDVQVVVGTNVEFIADVIQRNQKKE
jgi:PTS system N-acetylglucosamine-specific IIC component